MRLVPIAGQALLACLVLMFGLGPSARAQTAFDLRHLSPDVARVVVSARAQATEASRIASEACSLARTARAYAGYADSRRAPYVVVRYGFTDQVGTWRGQPISAGAIGVYTPDNLSEYNMYGSVFAGRNESPVLDNRGSGQRLDAGTPTGIGQLTYPNYDTYCGQVRRGLAEGLGQRVIFAQTTGSTSLRFAGQFARNNIEGVGVVYGPDGGRFEGEFRNGFLNGIGVKWHSDGSLRDAGRYERGVQVQAL